MFSSEVTQFQTVFAVGKISEHFLLPLLEQLIETFPFAIRGFHSDNGSEYINKKVAELLEKLHIEQTKSCACKTSDNALVESKNGSTVRKQLGYSHIPGRFAKDVNEFTSGILNDYLNFHRPFHFPAESVDAKGKLRKHYLYQDMQTPYEKLTSLAEASQFLRPGISFQNLDVIATQCSDNDAVLRLNQARAQLFQLINKSQNNAA